MDWRACAQTCADSRHTVVWPLSTWASGAASTHNMRNGATSLMQPPLDERLTLWDTCLANNLPSPVITALGSNLSRVTGIACSNTLVARCTVGATRGEDAIGGVIGKSNATNCRVVRANKNNQQGTTMSVTATAHLVTPSACRPRVC